MSIQGISSANSLLNSIGLTSAQQTSQQSSTTAAASTGSAVTDTVSLSSDLKNMENEALMSAESSIFGASGQTSSGDSMVNTLLGGSQDSTDPMVSILMGAENAELMKANPGLVQKILQQEGTASSGTTSASTATDLTNLQNINLLTMSPDTLASLLQQTRQSQAAGNSTATATGVGTQVDTVV